MYFQFLIYGNINNNLGLALYLVLAIAFAILRLRYIHFYKERNLLQTTVKENVLGKKKIRNPTTTTACIL